MNSMVLRGKILFVGEAKYRREVVLQNTRGKEVKVITRQDARGNNPQTGSVRVAKRKEMRQPSEAPIKDPNNNGWTKKVEVPIVNENIVWIQRSIVGGMKLAIDFNELEQQVHKEWPGVTQVRELGAYKAMLTFDTVLSAEEAYTFRMNDLLNMFYMVWRWDETERSESRRIWLECYGVPMHAWSGDTFCRIGEQCGEVTGNRRLVDGGEMQNEELDGISNKYDEWLVVVWDQAAVLMMADNRKDEQEKDRVVNSCVILNECNHKNSNPSYGNVNYAALKEREDSQGSTHNNKEADSEETVSHNYVELYANKSFDSKRVGYGLGANRPNKGSNRNEAWGKERACWTRDLKGLLNRTGLDPATMITRGRRCRVVQAQKATDYHGCGGCEAWI
ncbi:hypothetical protein AHAS_Ahas04G0166400 [Arachis hypogaea]